MTSCKLTLSLSALLLAYAPLALAQNNPVPLINNPLVPAALAPGGADFTLTVNGTGFVPSSAVNWNGVALETTFISVSQLTASVPASKIATENVASVTVVNPTPGGGTSNAQLFQANHPVSPVTVVNYAIPSAFGGQGIATGDFNGDGRPDLVVSPNYPCCGNAFIQVMINNGDGTLQSPVDYTVNILPQEIATGDFNGDGRLDLAVANSCGTDPNCATEGTVSILLGNGDGTFASAVSYASVNNSRWIEAGDFNGDGNLDLVVAGNGGISVSLGEGNGAFQQPVTYALGTVISVAVGDLDRNGTLDLIFSLYNSNQICTMSGNGDGSFQAEVCYTSMSQPWPVQVADVNNDGKLDASVLASDYLQVYLGNGDGTLAPPVNYFVAGDPFGLTAVDLNGDGILDFIAYTVPDLFLLTGNGDGTFQSSVVLDGFFGSYEMVPQDFNGDGKLDLGVGDSPNIGVNVLFQTTAILSPSALTFPVTGIGTKSVPMSVALTNNANKALEISGITIAGSDGADFSEQNNCGASLPAGKNCTIKVEFLPLAAGFRSALINIADSAPGSPQVINVSGMGSTAELKPTIADFGSEPVGKTSLAKFVTLTNAGTTILKVSSYGIDGTDQGDFAKAGTTCGSSLSPGAHCEFAITFTPTQLGIRTATLGVLTNGAIQREVQTVTLKGTGD